MHDGDRSALPTANLTPEEFLDTYDPAAFDTSIQTLFATGLSLDRSLAWREWNTTVRLLAMSTAVAPMDNPACRQAVSQVVDRWAVLVRAGPVRLPAGQPLSQLEPILLPLYLHHRYQLESAVKSLGGVFFTYAVREPGPASIANVYPKEIREVVAPARQREAARANPGLFGTHGSSSLSPMLRLLGKIYDYEMTSAAYATMDVLEHFRNARVMHAGDVFAGKQQPLIDRLFPQVRLSKVAGSLIHDSRDDLADTSRGQLVIVDGDLAALRIGRP